ncbi:MAG TPA: medium chain dehydrogenase/reductase family protein [Cellulomonas sp.]|nr:medium chain dehydrogenase/reductase family protein [Cellulomonas sp.]
MTRTTAAASDTLTEVVLPGVVEPEQLIVTTREIPAPAAGQILVRMEATGVSMAEQQMRRGKYYDQRSFPFVPGYDLVGTVEAVGDSVASDLLGRRVAAVTKYGGWSTHVLVDARSAVLVPEALSAAEAETLVVNGLTAWQLLHRVANVPDGGTVVIYGATGGVGMVLSQLAMARGVRVIGTASPRNFDALRELGVAPLDYSDPRLLESVRMLAPEGVDAVFDHIGGAGLTGSFRMLARGGTLAGYGSSATRDVTGAAWVPVLKLVGRLALWNVLPNGRSAHFYNLWAGIRRADGYWSRARDDLGRVFALAAAGQVRAPIGARLPLSRVAEAVRLAESKTIVGKVILEPDAPRLLPDERVLGADRQSDTIGG